MKVSREIVGAESVTVVTWPVQIPGCFLILWLLVWSPGVVLVAHYFLTAETIKSSGLLSGLPGWLQASIVMTMLLSVWCLALWGVLLSFFGKKGNYVVGANIAGFTKVADAMVAQGVC